ncbi:MAG: hypothetical protein SGPRY_012060, partial [Prymnesium sp.]
KVRLESHGDARCFPTRPLLPAGEDDIIDETLFFFKANVLFKQFEVKGAADRVLIYLTLYITQCLAKLNGCASKAEGLRALTSMAHEAFKIPGDPGFPLGSFFPSPANSQEAGARHPRSKADCPCDISREMAQYEFPSHLLTPLIARCPQTSVAAF